MCKLGKVAILAGGFSAERQVSLDSGRAVLTALQRQNIDAHLFDPKEKPLTNLVTENFQVAFNALHGTFGEDGVIQGALEALDIRYTGCGVLASALAMDKYRTRLIWQSLNLPHVPYIVLHDDSDFSMIEQKLGLPLFIKPTCEGSSVGVVKIKHTGELAQVYPSIKQYHGEVLAEPALLGGEFAVSILEGYELPTIQIIPQTEFFDYEAKYQRDDTILKCPCDLSMEEEKYLQHIAKQAFLGIGGRGFARVDFLRDEKSGQFYLNEINTIPGLTEHSLLPKSAQHAGLSFDKLCMEILSYGQ